MNPGGSQCKFLCDNSPMHGRRHFLLAVSTALAGARAPRAAGIYLKGRFGVRLRFLDILDYDL
jgi:hypothetical protein